MVFSHQYADAFAKFAKEQGREKFTARDIKGRFPFQLLPNLNKRGWIIDTGIKIRVKHGGKKRNIIVWQVTKDGFEAGPYLLRRQEGLDAK